jgi:hypothetical protein
MRFRTRLSQLPVKLRFCLKPKPNNWLKPNCLSSLANIAHNGCYRFGILFGRLISFVSQFCVNV